MPVWTEKGNLAAITMVEGKHSIPLQDCLQRLDATTAIYLLVHLLDEILTHRDPCHDLVAIKAAAEKRMKCTLFVCVPEVAEVLVQKGVAQEHEIRHELHVAILEVLRGPED